MPALHLVTVNSFGVPFLPNTRARLHTLAHELNRPDLDAVCIQEVHLMGQIPLLLKAMTQFPHAAFERFLYAPQGGLLTLSRWPIQEARFIPYRQHGSRLSPAFADWLLHKGILITPLALDEGPAVLINTHLMANYSADWSPGNSFARVQRQQLTQLIRMLDEIERDQFVVVVGDFNVPAGSALYREFVKAAGLQDLAGENAEPTFRCPPYWPARYVQALDHVLIRCPPGWTWRGSMSLVFADRVRLVNGKSAFLSDHMGIEATVEWHIEERRKQ